mmetsp:Transcript_31687/g.78962  ORF Transcript_31687/g.78962 Transcript_31687/m.78962 type:complete len:201 (-) Transcript_31687:1073-1675(-)
MHALRAPHDEEGVADILVRLTLVVVARLVNDLTDGICEQHHLVLQTLHGIGKLTNIAEPVRALLLLAPNHQVKLCALRVGQVCGDDLVASTAETQLHQTHNLRERHPHSLCLILGLALPFELQRGVLRELVHDVHHRLDRTHHERCHVIGKTSEHDEEHGNEEDGEQDVLERLLPLLDGVVPYNDMSLERVLLEEGAPQF